MPEYKVIKVKKDQVRNSNYEGQYAIVASMITQREPDSVIGTISLGVEKNMFIIAKDIKQASEILNDYVYSKEFLKANSEPQIIKNSI